ncbi:MAG TPA: type VII secretion EssA family protein, partial [Bacillaceae bacterium]
LGSREGIQSALFNGTGGETNNTITAKAEKLELFNGSNSELIHLAKQDGETNNNSNIMYLFMGVLGVCVLALFGFLLPRMLSGNEVHE